MTAFSLCILWEINCIPIESYRISPFKQNKKKPTILLSLFLEQILLVVLQYITNADLCMHVNRHTDTH